MCKKFEYKENRVAVAGNVVLWVRCRVIVTSVAHPLWPSVFSIQKLRALGGCVDILSCASRAGVFGLAFSSKVMSSSEVLSSQQA